MDEIRKEKLNSDEKYHYALEKRTVYVTDSWMKKENIRVQRSFPWKDRLCSLFLVWCAERNTACGTTQLFPLPITNTIVMFMQLRKMGSNHVYAKSCFFQFLILKKCMFQNVGERVFTVHWITWPLLESEKQNCFKKTCIRFINLTYFLIK